MGTREEQVQVIVRCRPMNQREKELGCTPVLAMSGPSCTITKVDPGNHQDRKQFTYDRCYPECTTTEHVYNDVVSPVVQSVTEGYNGTIFAYGQTSCGKTFTMQGVTDPTNQQGVIPRSARHIFKTIESSKEQFLVHASCFEIYNEEIRDLLRKNSKEKLDIGSTSNRGFYVKGLTKHLVGSPKQCQELIQRCQERRTTGGTDMNAESSRSHTVFTLSVEVQGEGGHVRVGKLNLVDLAGSERQRKTGAVGVRLQESIRINLSLHTLGRVISTLAERGRQNPVPYRESKLTRLLQDSLGGSARTLMVACVSPADDNYSETLSTLRFASRAKNIVNKPVINEDPKDAMLKRYQDEIRQLKTRLEQAGDSSNRIPDSQLQELLREMERKKEDDYAKEKAVMQRAYEDKLCELQRQLEEAKHRHQEDMAKTTKPCNKLIRQSSIDDFVAVHAEDEQEELRIVLIGKTGSGKSATGNTLAGSKIFQSKSSFVSITKETKCASANQDGVPLFLVDTPGLFDTLESNEDRRNEIMKCVALTSPGMHAILFVTQIGQFTQEEQDTVEFYKQSFGPHVVDHMIVVFTRGDNLEYDGITLEQYLEQAPAVLQDLVKDCSGRCIAVNNRADEATRRSFRKKLVEIVNTIVQTNNGKCYTNEMFETVETFMKSEEGDVFASFEDEKSLERDALEKAQSELLLREREELQRKAEEERLKQETIMEDALLEMDQMLQDLRQREAEKVEQMRQEQEKKMADLQRKTEQDLQTEKDLKSRLESELDENRTDYEQKLGKAQTAAEELQCQKEREIEVVREEYARQVEEERSRVEKLKKEKEEEILRLKEESRTRNEKLKEEDEQLARAIQKIYQRDYDAYYVKMERRARIQARMNVASEQNIFQKIVHGVLGSAVAVITTFKKK